LIITALEFAERPNSEIPRYAVLSILLLLSLKAGLSNSKEDVGEIRNPTEILALNM
jgi:hypothetical protein